eukprot:TRINITY_DN565_c0_g1_i4.p1 TRINITY_DN565_c0_g1~~TRINITY_DN565_c0_g1_i4.p1  ORF type:complete len:410 (-),score=38.91 TRINITY_DN565_c0_g1_i4:1285-2514(-)
MCECLYFYDPRENCTRSYFQNHGEVALIQGSIFLIIFCLLFALCVYDTLHDMMRVGWKYFKQVLAWARIFLVLGLAGDIVFYIWWIINASDSSQGRVWAPLLGTLIEMWWQGAHTLSTTLILCAWGVIISRALHKLGQRSELLKRNLRIHMIALVSVSILLFVAAIISATIQLLVPSTTSVTTAMGFCYAFYLILVVVVSSIDLVLTRRWWADPEGAATRKIRKKSVLLVIINVCIFIFLCVSLSDGTVLFSRVYMDRFIYSLSAMHTGIAVLSLCAFMFLQRDFFSRLGITRLGGDTEAGSSRTRLTKLSSQTGDGDSQKNNSTNTSNSSVPQRSTPGAKTTSSSEQVLSSSGTYSSTGAGSSSGSGSTSGSGSFSSSTGSSASSSSGGSVNGSSESYCTSSSASLSA